MTEVISESLQSDSQAINDHLDLLRNSDPELYTASVEAAVHFGPIDESCRLSVHIPTYQEGRRIYNTLQKMLVPTGGTAAIKQIERDGTILDPQSYEVLVYDSYPETEQLDGLLDEVERFNADYRPPVPIKVLSQALPQGLSNVGYARQLLQNATCLRLSQPRQPERPFYLVADEADLDGYDPYALASMRDFLDSNPSALFARLTNERDPRVLKQFPHLLIRYRFAAIVGTILQAKIFDDNCREVLEFCSRLPEASGASCAYPLGKLLAAGGFRPAEFGEDLDAGKRMMRQSRDTTYRGSFIRPVVVASPRRMLGSMIVDKPAYAHSNFKAIDHLVRQPESELIQVALQHYDTDQQRQTTQATVQRAFDRISAHTQNENNETAVRYLSIALLCMGFDRSDYSQDESGITITSWEQIEEKMSNYRIPKRISTTL